MRDIKTVTGKEVLDRYMDMYDVAMHIDDYNHFQKRFDIWLDNVRSTLERRAPSELSLSKRNFLGKKTRALLSVMEIKEPKTLGMLLGMLWESVPERFPENWK